MRPTLIRSAPSLRWSLIDEALGEIPDQIEYEYRVLAGEPQQA